MIIGLTGTKASGKQKIADLLKERGFFYDSTSDRVREEAKKRRGDDKYTTKELQDVGNDLRDKYGLDILARRTLDRVRTDDCAVIDGIRNLGEIAFLRKNAPEFYLVSVDAPRELRFQRLKGRGRESDPKTWEEFLAMDERDLGKGEEKSGQQTYQCMQEADYFVQNIGSLSDLQYNFSFGSDSFLTLFPADKRRRPSFNEMFMRQAWEWSYRSKCLRRKVGAVISTVNDDKRLNNIPISSGYNGPARGAPHCDEVGCLRTQMNIPSGQRQEICRAVHAEENAILNAGMIGARVLGAKMHSTAHPCSLCAKTINQSGIAQVIYLGDYPDSIAHGIFKDGKVEVVPYQGVSPKAFSKIWS